MFQSLIVVLFFVHCWEQYFIFIFIREKESQLTTLKEKTIKTPKIERVCILIWLYIIENGWSFYICTDYPGGNHLGADYCFDLHLFYLFYKHSLYSFAKELYKLNFCFFLLHNSWMFILRCWSNKSCCFCEDYQNQYLISTCLICFSFMIYF